MAPRRSLHNLERHAFARPVCGGRWAHGDLPARPRRGASARPRSVRGVLHRGAGPAGGRARRHPRLPQGLGRARPPLGHPHRGGPLRRRAHRVQDRERRRPRGLRDGPGALRLRGRAARARRGAGARRCHPLRHPERPRHGDLLVDGGGRERSAHVQPAADAVRSRGHRATPHRPLPAHDRERARHGPLHAGGPASSASPSRW